MGFGIPVQTVFFLSAVLGVVAYLFGDLFVLSKTNNTVATLADFALAFVLIWFTLDAFTDNPGSIFWGTVFSVVGLTMFEYFYHKYVANRVLNKHQTREAKEPVPNQAFPLQTEASEELTPETKKDDENYRNK
jgi:hypothetical protein